MPPTPLTIRKLLLDVGGIQWLLRDEFTTALAAGSVNGTAAEPGPGVRTVRDVESKISVAPGWVEWAAQATAVYAEQDLIYTNIPLTRTPGRIALCKYRWATDGGHHPLALVSTTTSTWSYTGVDAAFRRGASGLLYAVVNAGLGPAIVTVAVDNTIYNLAIIQRSIGASFFIKGGAYTNWTLLYRAIDGNASPLYVGSSGFTAVFSTTSYRIPVDLYLPTPLLSDGFGSTFGTTDGLGHAEGIAGGLGAGGSGLTWLSAGNWATAAGVASCTPVAGMELITDPGLETWASASDLTSWTESLVGTGSITQEGTIKNAGSYSAKLIGDANPAGNRALLSQDIADAIGDWLLITCMARGASGGETVRIGHDGGTIAKSLVLTTSFAQALVTVRVTNNAADVFFKTVGAGVETMYIDTCSVKKLPISTLIASQSLITTDVLAETVLSAYTLGTQAGLVQSDRPFAFPANADAASGQNVIVLKNLTNAVPDTDSITIKHPITPTTYTIASVSALVGGVQTLTLDSNLVEAVVANDMVGVNWASWNGFMTYLDGAGNIAAAEIKAGVYTTRGTTTAKAFAANARFIARKVGTEYRWFYAEALISSSTAVDAASMVGTYWGMFSTSASNTFNSTVIYDTGNVTNSHSMLDKFSRD